MKTFLKGFFRVTIILGAICIYFAGCIFSQEEEGTEIYALVGTGVLFIGMVLGRKRQKPMEKKFKRPLTTTSTSAVPLPVAAPCHPQKPSAWSSLWPKSFIARFIFVFLWGWILLSVIRFGCSSHQSVISAPQSASERLFTEPEKGAQSIIIPDFYGSEAEKDKAFETLRRYDRSFAGTRDSLVLIQTDRTVGTAFAAVLSVPETYWLKERRKEKGFLPWTQGKFIVTCRHLIDGASWVQLRLIDGTVVTPAEIEVAQGLDLVRMRYERAEYTPEADAVETDKPNWVHPRIKLISRKTPNIGNPVVIYGDTQGKGAITKLTGKILALGPDYLEVDVPFTMGNSGSPILDSTGHVIGVASHLETAGGEDAALAQGTRFTKVRRFGIRLHDGIVWQPYRR